MAFQKLWGLLFPLLLATQVEAKDYLVRKGDNLTKIGNRIGFSVEEILSCNPNIKQNNKLHPGQYLKLEQDYKVKKGDSLLGIVYDNGTTLSEVLDLNPRLKDQDLIYPRQILLLPCREHPAVKKSGLEEMTEDGEKKQKTKKKVFTKKKLRLPSGLELEVITDAKLTGEGKEFYDSWHSGNPLVRVRKEDLGKKVSKYFSLGEFARIETPALAKREFIQTRWGDSYYTHIRIEPDMLKRLDYLRAQLKRPVSINSGYRSYGYNHRLYQNVYRRKPTKSRHCSGDGVDINTGYKAIRRPAERIFKNGGIGKGSSFTHLDTRGWQARWHY